MQWQFLLYILFLCLLLRLVSFPWRTFAFALFSTWASCCKDLAPKFNLFVIDCIWRYFIINLLAESSKETFLVLMLVSHFSKHALVLGKLLFIPLLRNSCEPNFLCERKEINRNVTHLWKLWNLQVILSEARTHLATFQGFFGRRSSDAFAPLVVFHFFVKVLQSHFAEGKVCYFGKIYRFLRLSNNFFSRLTFTCWSRIITFSMRSGLL